jgi:hypothetical protein
MKKGIGRGLAVMFILLCPSLATGCFWRERQDDRGAHAERRDGHDNHDHERRGDDRRDNERR